MPRQTNHDGDIAEFSNVQPVSQSDRAKLARTTAPLVMLGPGGDYQRTIHEADISTHEELISRGAAMVGAVVCGVLGVLAGVVGTLAVWV